MKRVLIAAMALLLAGCNGRGDAAASGQAAAGRGAFTSHPVATFNEPWAMSFLPDGRLLVTEKPGTLKLLRADGSDVIEVGGMPAVDYGGQGGLGDVAVHPGFATNRWVYLSYVEAGERGRGAAVARATLVEADGKAGLSNLTVIWRQLPKMRGRGHYGHRLLFDRQGKLWVTSGDRQEFTPAQDLSGNLGKLLRLNDDGSTPADNPFAAQGPVPAQAWTLGHRNPLGMAFDGSGRLWLAEMGPRGGDELNLVVRGRNYGWPLVSDGDHYDGATIPDHSTAPQFEAPKLTWTPVIAPGGMIVYSGDAFPAWKGQALIAGLASQALVRVRLGDAGATEVARHDMGGRIREVEQGPDGRVWLLEDGSGGRLLRLDPTVAPGT